MDDDDFDILNDADELAFFDKLDKLGAGHATEDEEEEELLIIPSKPSKSQPSTSFKEIHANNESPTNAVTDDEDAGRGYVSGGAESPTNFQSNEYRSSSPSSKRVVTFHKLEGIDAYQERNRALIRAQSNFLHPRAVLFVGSVMSVTLPSSVPFDTENCELMYRILFIEGGSQPAMFRCKTPIFTSSGVELSHQVAVWDDHTFRFDMLMPDAEAGEDPHYLNVQGEVMLSLYRKKANGGNDLVAQFSVDLQGMKQRGTKEIFEKEHNDGSDSLEGRSMNGTFPLSIIQPGVAKKSSEEGKQGDSASNEGEIEIQFNIAWHREDPRGDNGGGDGASLDGGRTHRSRTSSAGPQRSLKNGSTATGKPSGAKSATQTTARPKSATATLAPGTKKASATNQYKYEQPRKIVSKLDRQRKEMERKIAKENTLLHAKIAKQVPDQGPHKSQASASLIQGKLTAYQNYDAVLSSVKKGNTNGNAATTGTNNNPRIVSIPADVLEKDTPQWRQYQQLYETLKKDIRDEENHVRELRAKLSNINTQIQRQEAGVEKAKMFTTGAASSSGASTAAGSVGRHGSHHHHADAKDTHASVRTSRDSKAGDMSMLDSARLEEEQQDIDNENNNVELGAWAELSYMPGALENVQDGEYCQLAEEFQILQRLRRSLLERIVEARKFSGNAVSQQQQLDEKLNIVKGRLWHIKQNHVDEFGSIIQMNDAPPMTTTKRLTGADAKDEDNDLALYDRLLSLRTEITSMQVQGGFTLASAEEEMVPVPSGPAHPEILALQSTRGELETMLHKLKTQIERAEIEVARLQQEQKEKVALVSDVVSQREALSRRAFIADMRAMEMRLNREERFDALTQATKDVELQMIHYRMVTKERNELRSQQELLDQQQEEYKKLIGSAGAMRPRSPSPDHT